MRFRLKLVNIIAIHFCQLLWPDVHPVSNSSMHKICPIYQKNITLKPPMGWSSFDAYDCRINEKEFVPIVDYMTENLLLYGW